VEWLLANCPDIPRKHSGGYEQQVLLKETFAEAADALGDK
jgi:hypothetical protein